MGERITKAQLRWALIVLGVIVGVIALPAPAGAAKHAEDERHLSKSKRHDDGKDGRTQPGTRYVDPIFETVDITSDIPFGHAVNNRGQLQELQLDLYRPSGDRARNRPAVVFAHGGGFVGGDKADGEQVRYLTGMAQRGYVVMSIDYRVRPRGTPGAAGGPQKIVDEYTGDSQIITDAQHDMQAAVRWVRGNARELRIDSNTVIASGSSAGAVTAMQTGFNPEDPGASGNPGPSSTVAAVVSLWGAGNPNDIEAGAPPIIDFHGAQDVPVPLPLATLTCARTISLLNICEQTIWPEERHPAWGRLDEIFAGTTSFLCRRVLGDCAGAAPVAPILVAP